MKLTDREMEVLDGVIDDHIKTIRWRKQVWKGKALRNQNDLELERVALLKKIRGEALRPYQEFTCPVQFFHYGRQLGKTLSRKQFMEQYLGDFRTDQDPNNEVVEFEFPDPPEWEGDVMRVKCIIKKGDEK